MIKKDLIERLAKKGEITKQFSETLVDAILRELKKALEKGEEIELRGFGCFRIREQGPRPGRNPKTGEVVEIPARKAVFFKPSRLLKIKL